MSQGITDNGYSAGLTMGWGREGNIPWVAAGLGKVTAHGADLKSDLKPESKLTQESLAGPS